MNKVICLTFSLNLDLFPIPTLFPTDNSSVFAANLCLFAVITDLTSNQNKATVLLDRINLAYSYCSSFHIQPQPRPMMHQPDCAWKLIQAFLPCRCLSLSTPAPAKVSNRDFAVLKPIYVACLLPVLFLKTFSFFRKRVSVHYVREERF